MERVNWRVEVINRAKIVGTLGPACSAAGTMQEMIEAGMDVARVNFSHGTVDANLELIAKVRQAAAEVGRIVPVIQDLQGPKIRTGELPPGGVALVEESVRTFRVGVASTDGEEIPVPYQHFHDDLEPGDRILLDDGLLELEVVDTGQGSVRAKVLQGGTLLSYQGITVPTRTLSIETLTEKDRSDLALGLKQAVDFVALSFVRTAQDVKDLRDLITELLPSDGEVPAVIVKIEKHEAIENFDAILKETDAVMIARGDLGLETSVSAVPVAQKELIAKCLVAGKPVITATDMLSSMATQARPTRAEASDVANAVLDHTDAVMLSEETAMGRYPVKTVSTMADIIASTEESSLDHLMPNGDVKGEPVALAVAGAGVELARYVDAVAILVTTHSGYSARSVAQFRPEVPIFAATDDPRVQRQMQLSWGIEPLLVEGYSDPEQMMRRGLKMMHGQYDVAVKSRIVVVSGLKRATEGYDSSVRVVEV